MWAPQLTVAEILITTGSYIVSSRITPWDSGSTYRRSGERGVWSLLLALQTLLSPFLSPLEDFLGPACGFESRHENSNVIIKKTPST
jgi:hypothetical protein